jgi:hypothetical protein
VGWDRTYVRTQALAFLLKPTSRGDVRWVFGGRILALGVS